MNYKVLYRKYRPNNFENIVGQEYIVKTLKNSIISQNISHAYIFSGPRGTGKTSTAKVFSKAINCIENINGEPCEKCAFCCNFQENPDIIEIDAASNNGVDEIRNLIDNIKLTPTNGKYKVYIIDEVHMLTPNAFNALLLTLEEPPKHAIFILATTNIENVPITILSRCQRYDFKKISIDDIVERLKRICEIENINIEEDALKEIAFLAEGGLRDALSLLDQLSKGNDAITLEIVEKQIKTISQKKLIEFIEIIENNDVEKFIEEINDYRNRAIDYKTFIKKLIEIAANKAKNIKLNGKYQRLDYNSYKNLIIDLTECLTKININVDPYTILEIILLNYFNITMVNTKKEVINEKIIDEEVKTEIEKNDVNQNEIINIRINNCFVNAQKKFLEEIKTSITKLLELTDIPGKIKSILLDSNVVVASNEYAIFTCEFESAAINANKILEEIEKEINRVCNNLKVIFISNDKWDIEKEKYINNLKKNIKYEYIKEKNNNTDDIIISDVFDISKVEII